MISDTCFTLLVTSSYFTLAVVRKWWQQKLQNEKNYILPHVIEYWRCLIIDFDIHIWPWIPEMNLFLAPMFFSEETIGDRNDIWSNFRRKKKKLLKKPKTYLRTRMSMNWRSPICMKSFGPSPLWGKVQRPETIQPGEERTERDLINA